MLEFGQWIKDYHVRMTLKSKSDLHQYVSQDLIRDRPIDYMEFGVFEGRSMRTWIASNQHPHSRFFGFDTFEGLPEDWRDFIKFLPKGTFSTDGKLPDIHDPRVKFFKGVFQNTLPGFLKDFTAQNRLVINCDADLYTSTLYVLASLNHLIVPGTIVLFDELSSMQEFRAFRDYSQSFMRRYKVLAASEPFYLRVAVEFL
ncbi:MAG: macrocin O-methyltransferase [Chloroflexi bacterium]|nr:macrocin O-methyltransferase [Chloroflexota bacterium]